jgi:hypothetical protein
LAPRIEEGGGGQKNGLKRNRRGEKAWAWGGRSEAASGRRGIEPGGTNRRRHYSFGIRNENEEVCLPGYFLCTKNYL